MVKCATIKLFIIVIRFEKIILLNYKLIVTLHTKKREMINLPSRKLNLIQYLAQSQDEVFLETLEQMILK